MKRKPNPKSLNQKSLSRQLRSRLGKNVIVQSMGGGCWCLQNYGKCTRLAEAGFPVDHFYGVSAGTVAGFAFWDHQAFQQGFEQFIEHAKQNQKNFYWRKLLEGNHPFPHPEILKKISFHPNKNFRPKEKAPPVTAVMTRQWKNFPHLSYPLSLLSFFIQYGFSRRLPFGILENFYNQWGEGLHLNLYSRLGILPQTVTLNRERLICSPMEFVLGSVSLWPVFSLFHHKRIPHADGGLLANNPLPIILKKHRRIDTLISLIPEPAIRYHDRYLGIFGYQKKVVLGPHWTLFTEAEDRRLPRRHLIWDMNRPKLHVFDYADGESAAEEFALGYEAGGPFLDSLLNLPNRPD